MNEIACAGLVKKEDEYIIVEESKATTEGLWSLPAGRLEADETLEECISREVKEETGVRAVPVGLVGIYIHVDEDNLTPIIVYEMECNDEDTELNPLEDDVLTAEWADQNTIAKRKLRSGYVLKAIQDLENRGSVSTSYVEKLDSLQPTKIKALKMRFKAVRSTEEVLKSLGIVTAVVMLFAFIRFIYELRSSKDL